MKQGEQVEGRHAVLELLRARRRKVHSVWLADGQDRAPILAEIAQLAEDQGVAVRHVGAARLAADAYTSAPQGVLARADPVPTVALDDLLAGSDGVVPFLLAIEWAFIFLPIIYHTVYGVWITFTCQPNVGHYRYGKNWFYLWQRVSAIGSAYQAIWG